MKTTYYLALMSLVFGVMTLVPAAAHASTTMMAHTHEHLTHDRTPRVHDHTAHSHRS